MDEGNTGNVEIGGAMSDGAVSEPLDARSFVMESERADKLALVKTNIVQESPRGPRIRRYSNPPQISRCRV